MTFKEHEIHFILTKTNSLSFVALERELKIFSLKKKEKNPVVFG